MAKMKGIDSARVGNMIKAGSPRKSKKKKGNPKARTSRSGNGKRLR